MDPTELFEAAPALQESSDSTGGQALGDARPDGEEPPGRKSRPHRKAKGKRNPRLEVRGALGFWAGAGGETRSSGLVIGRR